MGNEVPKLDNMGWGMGRRRWSENKFKEKRQYFSYFTLKYILYVTVILECKYLIIGTGGKNKHIIIKYYL